MSNDDIMRRAERRNQARDIETVRQAVLELSHCIFAGPDWFTQGRNGQQKHASGWASRATESLKVIQETLEQAQDCIRGDIPEDCSIEEARADIVEKIRRALGLLP